MLGQNKQTLATATATQALKVGAATTVRDNKIQVSTDKESKGVADDRAEADQIEGDAVAAHRVAVDAETAKCTAIPEPAKTPPPAAVSFPVPSTLN